jgi:hypothetical protein
MGVRLHNPATGRFLSVDPIPRGNANAYTYPTDPINDYDISGLSIGGWIHKHASAILTGVSIAAGVAGLTPLCAGVCEAVAGWTGALASGANAVLEVNQHQYLGAPMDTAGVATFGTATFFQKVVNDLMPEYGSLVGKTGTKNARHKVGRLLGRQQAKLARSKEVSEQAFWASIGTMPVGQAFSYLQQHRSRRHRRS